MVQPDPRGTCSRRQSEPRPASSASGKSRGLCLRTGRHRLPQRRERQSRRRPRPRGCACGRPDRITIYGTDMCGLCNSEREVVEQVRRTVIHEVGITSDAPTPGWASSDGKSAVSIPLVSDVRTAQPITLVGPRLLAHGPSERHVRRSSPAMAHDRVLLIAAIGAGISLMPDASSEPRCQYVWASPHYRSQERTRVTSVTQERRRRVARNAGGQGPTTSTQRWSIVGCPRPVSRAVVPEPASSVIPRSVGVIGMAAHASERALVLRCLRLPAARSSRPRAFQNSG